jgi:hypothetical protein
MNERQTSTQDYTGKMKISFCFVFAYVKVATINTPLGCSLEIFEFIDNKLVNQIRKYKVAQLVHHVGVVEYGITLPLLLQDRQLLAEKDYLRNEIVTNYHRYNLVGRNI